LLNCRKFGQPVSEASSLHQQDIDITTRHN
jgi:hypothetical protein